jgi:glycosyltransferase involved in cell wall biosynthesis
MRPLVSVILAVYNRSASIARAVESVLAQTYTQIELIVVDDGSTDATPAVLEGFGSRITLLRQPQRGVYAARNLALRQARGELVAFLDSDDVWRPHKLDQQVPLFDRDRVGLVFGDARVVTLTGPTPRTQFQITPPRRGRVLEHFAYGNFVPTITVVARREALGLFEDVPLAADYLAWFRVAQHHELDYVDDIVADYTVHPAGISQDLGRSLEARIALFARELDRTTDPRTRVVIQRVLASLSALLATAVLRGRARSVARPLQLAWRTMTRTGGPWRTAALALRLAVSRGRRVLS